MSLLPVPVYSIYDRDIPLAHIRVCVIVNPVSPAEDKRAPAEQTVASCEGSACAIRSEVPVQP
jgi:hypothetical protein